MAFKKISSTVRGRSTLANAARISFNGPKGRNAQIRFSRDLASKLGFGKGDKLAVSVGTGADRGRVLVEKAANGEGGYSCFLNGALPALNIAASKLGSVGGKGSHDLAFALVDGGIVLVLPGTPALATVA
jgi:hypothetical protein